MSCKHLLRYSHSPQIWSVASCSAKNSPYVPSLQELERYCQCGNHIVCPAFFLLSMRGVWEPEGHCRRGPAADNAIDKKVHTITIQQREETSCAGI
jgi:hypothetical protein